MKRWVVWRGRGRWAAAGVGSDLLVRFLCVVMVVVALLLCAGCSHSGAGATRVRAMGNLIIDSDPEDAEIYVDDRYIGVVGVLNKSPIAIAEGEHRLEVRRDGYFSSYHEIRVVKGVRQRLRVSLTRVPFSGTD